MTLPLAERVALAQTLWQSIGEPSTPPGGDDEAAILDEADRRDGQLASGTVASRTHEQVISAARRALG